MLKKNKLRLGVATTAALAAAALAFTAMPANADPSGFKTLAGVGSDTIQDVMNGMSSVVPAIGSYDAINPSTGVAGENIQTKSGGVLFTRPNGSGQGVQALSDSIEGGTHQWTQTDSISGSTITTHAVNVTNQIDFARASGFQGSTGSDLAYIPFATDAVTYAVNAGSDFPRNIPLGAAGGSTTTLTLYNIYHCTKTSYGDSNGDTVTIHPLVPQSGSGTAKFWASTLGFSDSALPSCVKRVNTDSTPVSVEEHNGTSIDDVGDIVPFSIAQYIAQGNHASLAQAYGTSVTERRGNVVLGSINGQPAIRMDGTKTVMNPSFPVTRSVFNVVSTSRITGSDPIVATFVGANSAVCSQTALIEAFGFQTVSNCGSTALQGAFTQ